MVVETSLKVAEANQDDVDKGIVRIDSQIMKQIGASPGIIIEINGEKSTVAIADRAFPADLGLNIIRMDSLLRRNAGTSIGETVKIKVADATPAKRIVIAPAQRGVVLQAQPGIIQRAIIGRALTKGDIISMGGTRKRRRTFSGSPFENLFDFEHRINPEFGFGNSFLSGIRFLVLNTAPKGAVLVTEDTQVELRPEASELEEESIPDIAYEDIGGLEEEVKKVREMIELPLKHPVVFERLGIQPPKGVLLYGPPGTGKTLLAKAVANESKAHFISLNGPEIMSKFVGEAEKKLRQLFEDAEKNAPAILFIDEIDAIAPKREESYGEVERRVVAQMLALMDGLKGRGKVIVIAATNRPDALDPALRRGGRFDREIEIGVPNKKGRFEIFKIHTRNMSKYTTDSALRNMSVKSAEKKAIKILLDHATNGKALTVAQIKQIVNNLESKSDKALFKKLDMNNLRLLIKKVKADPKIVDISELAETTHGFVGADIEALSKEAAMNVIRNVISKEGLEKNEEISEEILQKLIVTKDDFKEALKMVRPSAMREVLVEAPKVYWEMIGGLSDAKKDLREAVEWPLKNPGVFRRMGIQPPKGILIYGPPGTGKTLLAKAVATESKANFISVKGPEVLSKWVGESEKAIREIFKKARQVSPSVVFFDEIDSIASSRGGSSENSKVNESVLNQILTELDGLEELTDVVVIAATNRPELIDPALLRPGRFDRHILALAPDEAGLYEILKVHTSSVPLDKVDIKKLATKLKGYSGADIESVVREAAMHALRKNIKANKVTNADFKAAMSKVKPSLTHSETGRYEKVLDSLKMRSAPSYMG